MKSITITLFCITLFSGCYKENRIAEKLNGKWRISELQWANGTNVEINNDIHDIEFFNCENAYTATCEGVYSIDYMDTSKVDLRDTFKYDIKNNELAVTSVKVTTGLNLFVLRFLRQRFDINTLDENNIQLNRIETFRDSTQGFLKATKK